MFKNTKTVIVLLLSLVLLLIVVTNTMIADDEWECSGACAGCKLKNCEVHILNPDCCAYCKHTYLGRVYCCAPNDGCYYHEI